MYTPNTPTPPHTTLYPPTTTHHLTPPCPTPPLHHTLTPNHPTNTNTADSPWQLTNHPSNTHGQAAFLNHMVIPPPEKRGPQDPCKTTFVVIDSASRNQSEFPNSNQYSIPLPSEIRDVKSLQLVSYRIPRPQCPVRSTNNVFHFTSQHVSITPEVDGTYTIDEHKLTNLHSVHVDIGTYAPDITPHDQTDPVLVAFRSEVEANTGKTLQQDDLARALEIALLQNGNTTHLVHVDPVTEQHTIRTDFSNPTGSPNDCTNPIFFKPFFQGCEEYYNGSITEKVEVPADPSNCPPPGGPKCPTYTTCTYGKVHHKYLSNSIGPVIGHPCTDPQTRLVGIAGNMEDNGTLRGIGTRFGQELQKGDWLYVVERDNPTNRYRVHVNKVVSDTEALIDCDGTGSSAPTVSFEDAYLWSGRVTLPWARNLQPDCYISMFVNCAKTLKSFTPAIDGAFYLVPAIKNEFYDIPEYLPFKTFSPILGRLDKLEISFKNPDNTLYDFMGKNHVLMFKVVHYRQNVGYGDV